MTKSGNPQIHKGLARVTGFSDNVNVRDFSRVDVVIVGAGPAGLSAALWAHELGLSCEILERSGEVGGQLLVTYNPINNYLGRDSADGREMRDAFLAQVTARGISVRCGAGIIAVGTSPITAMLDSGETIESRALVLATGVRRRRLQVPGESEFLARGIIDSGKKNAKLVRDKNVVIVGGGDAALENALILGESAASVTLVHRRSGFSARPEFVASVASHPTVRVLTGATVESVNGGSAVESVTVRTPDAVETVPADAVLIRIGVEPNSDLFRGITGLNSAGYVTVDRNCRTDREGLYAVGDVANPVSPTISSAAGMGATAAKAISAWINN